MGMDEGVGVDMGVGANVDPHASEAFERACV